MALPTHPQPTASVVNYIVGTGHRDHPLFLAQASCRLLSAELGSPAVLSTPGFGGEPKEDHWLPSWPPHHAKPAWPEPQEGPSHSLVKPPAPPAPPQLKQWLWHLIHSLLHRPQAPLPGGSHWPGQRSGSRHLNPTYYPSL